jgi:alpha-tubulin suppressor-like RCC1 family protein
MKKTKPAFAARLGAAIFACALLVMGCPSPADSDSPPPPPGPEPAAQLENTVYGGLNPGGAWVNVSFKADGKVICSFSNDNSTNEWSYTYQDDRTGAISSGGWSPGAFTLSADGGTLTFTNFGNHGASKTFDRLRKKDLTPSPSPAGLVALPAASLAGSVWGGGTPQKENTGWLTLAFKSGMKVVCAFSADNTTNEWDYTYANNAGAITTGSGWAGPGSFTVTGDGGALVFDNYGGHGAAKTFYRYYQEGSVWTISGVSITPESATVQKGQAKDFTAEAQGTGGFPQTIAWSLTGSQAEGTSIDQNGKLTVALDEGAAVLTVRAAATGAPDKYAEAAVTLQDPPVNRQPVPRITAGGTDTFLIKPDGTLWAAGSNQYGQHGNGLYGINAGSNAFVQVKDAAGSPITQVKQAAIGSGCTVILKEDGTVWGSGRNGNGSLGFGSLYSGTANYLTRFTQLTVDGTASGAPITGVTALSQNPAGAIFLLKNGEIWTAGTNTDGQLGMGDLINKTVFTQVATDSEGNPINGVEAVYAFNGNSYFIKGGQVWAAGYNVNGQLGLGVTANKINKFTKIPGMTGAAKIIAAPAGGLAVILKTDGTVWGAGLNDSQDKTFGMTGNFTSFTQITGDGTLTGTPITGIRSLACFGGNLASVVLLKEDGTVLITGNIAMAGLYRPPEMTSNEGYPYIIGKDKWGTGITGVQEVANGFFLLNDGTVLGSGSNGVGRLGIGVASADSTPVGLWLDDATNHIRFAQ